MSVYAAFYDTSVDCHTGQSDEVEVTQIPTVYLRVGFGELSGAVQGMYKLVGTYDIFQNKIAVYEICPGLNAPPVGYTAGALSSYLVNVSTSPLGYVGSLGNGLSLPPVRTVILNSRSAVPSVSTPEFVFEYTQHGMVSQPSLTCQVTDDPTTFPAGINYITIGSNNRCMRSDWLFTNWTNDMLYIVVTEQLAVGATAVIPVLAPRAMLPVNHSSPDPEPPCYCDSKQLASSGHDAYCQYYLWKQSRK